MDEQAAKQEEAQAVSYAKPFANIKMTPEKYLIIASILVLISIIYWGIFSAHALATYHEYTDLGRATYDMYYHLHYPSVLHGLEYLVFENHIMPDQLLVLPIFALMPSPMTLLEIQVVLLSCTGLVAFFIAKDLLKSPKIGLLLCIAFLLNPGMHGLLSFDYHAEAAIPLFVLLTFYFMMKSKPVYFAISLTLLLGLIDVSPFVGLGLGVPMMAYAFLREKDSGMKKSLIIYSAVVIVASIAAFLIYSAMVGSLSHAYVAGQYSTLPQFLKLNDIVGTEVAGIATNFSSSGALALYFTMFLPYLIFAMVLIFLGFGIAGLLDPLMTILFLSPYLASVFILNFSNVIFIWNQYFGYALGGGIIATILAIKHVNESDHNKTFLSFYKQGKRIAKYLPLSIVVCAVLLFLISPHFVYSKNINNLKQDYLFITAPAEQAQIGQLTSVLKDVPSNATLMAPFFTMSQMSQREYFELIPSGYDSTTLQPTNTPTLEGDGMWFVPQYIVADFNPDISLNAESGYQAQDFLNITGATYSNGTVTFNGIYAIYAYNGTAILLKRK